MSVPIPSIEPSLIVAGDTVQWTKSVPDYPATDGWTLKYAFQLIDSATTPISVTATTSGADYAVTITSAVSAAYPAGSYIGTGYVDDGTHRHTVRTWPLIILPLVTGAYGTTHASRTLALIEAAIEGRVPRGLESAVIDGQSIIRIPLNELVLLRFKYQLEVKAELDRARIAAGLPSRRTILAKFTRPQ